MGLLASGFSAPTDAWFGKAFAAPTPLQEAAWARIRAGESTLLVAPTGSGKTLAAFLWAIDRLVQEPDRGTRVVYVSPLKALAVDVDKNLRAPLAGIVAEGAARTLRVGVRTGDTPAGERAKMQRRSPDVLVTTPESLFLMCTSRMRDALTEVDTVIVDEIHALAGTKRGAHLAVSLERLEALAARPLQRIGLSATVRPLERVARFLGGHDGDAPRPVSLVDVPMPRTLRLAVEPPRPDLLPEDVAIVKEHGLPPYWASALPMVLQLIREHRSTMVFVNSRGVAERVAAALSVIAGDEIVLPHHGSLSQARRKLAEDRLKAGDLPGIVCTSTLELGIDVGAVDLVIQIEAPPTIAAGLQRVGRSGHVAFGTSEGRVFTKHPGDLLSAAAVARGMSARAIEPVRVPENPLDVLAQQLIAMCAATPMRRDAAFELVRKSAPFVELSRSAFDGVVELLLGKYPSTAFRHLKPRLVLDRKTDVLRAHEGAAAVLLANAGTIPDRGLYGVFLAVTDGERGGKQVGELDEELVHESRVGDVLQLGATAWRITQITFDRVLVEPGPLHEARLPFWIADGIGRSADLGREIATLTGKLARAPRDEGRALLEREHHLVPEASQALVDHVKAELEAMGAVPDETTIVVEVLRPDGLGEVRVCVLSPMGRPVLVPIAMCMQASLRRALDADVRVLWADDGFVLRLPDVEEVPDLLPHFPAPETLARAVSDVLHDSPLFAGRFREAAGRALLLPKRRPGDRHPLWAQRRKAHDLMRVASKYPEFPILLEAYRECLRDVFDLETASRLLGSVRSGETRLVVRHAREASPFAKTLMFSYIGAFMYEDDLPLDREKKLRVDQAELRLLLGDEDLSLLMEPGEVTAFVRRMQRLDDPSIVSADRLAGLLRELGDLAEPELLQRAAGAAALLATLRAEGRVADVVVAGERRVVLAEDAARYAALGDDPAALGEVVARWARTHGPFTSHETDARFGVPTAAAVESLAAEGALVRVRWSAWDDVVRVCDVDVFRALKLRALARRREAVVPVDGAAFARFSLDWQGVGGEDEPMSVVERLEGCELPASDLVREIVPARLGPHGVAELEALMAAGEVLVRGAGSLGERDGRIALHAASRFAALAPQPSPPTDATELRVRDALRDGGALFFPELAKRVGGFPPEVLSALWSLFWAGHVTNDTLRPLRSRLFEKEVSRHVARRAPTLPGSEGRWSLLPEVPPRSEAERKKDLAETLLARHGVITKGALDAEGSLGLWDVLRAMEDRGRVRSGYFVERLGGTQFAEPRAMAYLDDAREVKPRTVACLASTDPANPYGAALAWPEGSDARRPQRAAGTRVVMVGGRAAAWIGRDGRSCLTFTDDAVELAGVAGVLADPGASLLVETVDGRPAAEHPLAKALVDAGFVGAAKGALRRGA